MLPNLREKRSLAERLGHVPVRPQVESLRDVVVPGWGGEHDHLDLATGHAGAELAEDVPSIQTGHHHIEYAQVWVSVVGEVEGDPAIAGG
jgi:hypothetical protein